MAAEGSTGEAASIADVRERILATASELFYREGVRAIGVDLIVERAGVAKTSLYRHFRTKDDLVEAFLKREDLDFWEHWDAVARRHVADPVAELDAQLDWMGARIARPGYRGCPQINVAAEFSDPAHPARVVALAHKREMRRRIAGIAGRIGLRDPAAFASRLALVIDGAFTSAPLLVDEDPAAVLKDAARALLDASARSG